MAKVTIGISKESHTALQEMCRKEKNLDIGFIVRLAIDEYVAKCDFARFAPSSMYHVLEEYESVLSEFQELKQQLEEEIYDKESWKEWANEIDSHSRV